MYINRKEHNKEKNYKIPMIINLPSYSYVPDFGEYNKTSHITKLKQSIVSIAQKMVKNRKLDKKSQPIQSCALQCFNGLL